MTDTKSLSERLCEIADQIDKAADALDQRDAEIALELAQQSALIAQAAAALEIADEAINPPDRSGISMDTWNKRLKEGTTAIREALAAIRAKEQS